MVIDNLKNCKLYYGMHKSFEAAFDFIQKAVDEDLPVGKYELDGKNLYASVQEYDSKLPENAKAEGHNNYIDIQFVVSGVECADVFDIANATPKSEYNDVKDVMFYEDSPTANKCTLSSGEYGIFFPHDIHKPGMCKGAPSPVKKIVVKVKI